MEFKDYYQILNISQDANAADIKKAFRTPVNKKSLITAVHPMREDALAELLENVGAGWRYYPLTTTLQEGKSVVVYS